MVAAYDRESHTKDVYDYLPAYKRTQDALLRPVASVLAAIGMTPAMVSAIGMLFMVAFALLVRQTPQLALVFLVASIFADFLDGALARNEKKESSAGRLFDVVADNTSFVLFALGLVLADVVSAGSIAILVGVVAASAWVNTLHAVRVAHQKNIPVAFLQGYWFFSNFAKYMCYLLFVLFALGGPLLFAFVVAPLSVVVFIEVIMRSLALIRHA